MEKNSIAKQLSIRSGVIALISYKKTFDYSMTSNSSIILNGLYSSIRASNKSLS